MQSDMIVLIDNDAEDLLALEIAIKEVRPECTCLSMIFPDEAVNLISNILTTSPRYIFIDVHMQRMTGPECLVAFRTLLSAHDCKIVMFSGVMPPAVGEAFKTLGANDYFQKPLIAAQYKSVIAEIMGRIDRSVVSEANP